MKKGLILTISLMAVASINATADIKVKVPQNSDVKSLQYYYAPIEQYAKAKTRAERGLVRDSVAVADFTATIAIPQDGNSYMAGVLIGNNPVSLYLAPGDNVTIDVQEIEPVPTYALSGSPIADGMNELLKLEAPITEAQKKMMSSGNNDEAAMEALESNYTTIQKNFIKNNPDSPAAPVALMNLDGEDFVSAYDSMPASLQNSVLYPLVKKQYESEKINVEALRKQKELSSGTVDAPNFTLKDLDGKDVSLSDFKGKWVILDFWGSWCPWCIKGFPELKEAYKKYAGKLEIIGVDCNEGEAEWRAGVAKYELPWVNVYNPADSKVLSEFGVRAFPTKAIISPEGKIKNITVGHDPRFFTALSELIGE